MLGKFVGSRWVTTLERIHMYTSALACISHRGPIAVNQVYVALLKLYLNSLFPQKLHVKPNKRGSSRDWLPIPWTKTTRNVRMRSIPVISTVRVVRNMPKHNRDQLQEPWLLTHGARAVSHTCFRERSHDETTNFRNRYHAVRLASSLILIPSIRKMSWLFVSEYIWICLAHSRTFFFLARYIPRIPARAWLLVRDRVRRVVWTSRTTTWYVYTYSMLHLGVGTTFQVPLEITITDWIGFAFQTKLYDSLTASSQNQCRAHKLHY